MSVATCKWRRFCATNQSKKKDEQQERKVKPKAERKKRKTSYSANKMSNRLTCKGLGIWGLCSREKERQKKIVSLGKELVVLSCSSMGIKLEKDDGSP